MEVKQKYWYFTGMAFWSRKTRIFLTRIWRNKSAWDLCRAVLVLQPKEEDGKITFHCRSPPFASCVQLRVQSLCDLVSLKLEEDFAYSALQRAGISRADLEVNPNNPKVLLQRDRMGRSLTSFKQEDHLLTQVMCATQVKGVTAMDVVVKRLLYQVLGLVTC